jgi:hypothetical protein
LRRFQTHLQLNQSWEEAEEKSRKNLQNTNAKTAEGSRASSKKKKKLLTALNFLKCHHKVKVILW